MPRMTAAAAGSQNGDRQEAGPGRVARGQGLRGTAGRAATAARGTAGPLGGDNSTAGTAPGRLYAHVLTSSRRPPR